MQQLPPIFREAEFAAIDTRNPREVEERFRGPVDSLHQYLNELPCLSDIQCVRKRWKTKVGKQSAFGSFACTPKHWYTYHNGGRAEAQFNIGMFDSHLRVGLGFEFTKGAYGNPDLVGKAYSSFLDVIRSDVPGLERFIRENQLEIECLENPRDTQVSLPQPRDVTAWLLDRGRDMPWVFVGRILRKGRDTVTLSNATRLDAVFRSVLCGFRPIWERTQMRMHGLG